MHRTCKLGPLRMRQVQPAPTGLHSTCTYLIWQVHIDGVLNQQGGSIRGLQQRPRPRRRLLKPHLCGAAERWP